MSSDEEIFTKDEILSISKKNWDGDFKVIDYNIKSYSEERLGFMSLHRSLTITIQFTKSKTKHSNNFFIKCTPAPNDPLTICMLDMGVVDREIAFYRDIIPLLQQDFKEEEAWAPSCFGITKNAMILEDLRIKNFELANKTFTLEETKSLLSAIARMQSASIIAEKKLGQPLNEAYPEAFDLSRCMDPKGFFIKWYQAGINLGIAIAKELGLDTSNIQSTCNKIFDFLKPSKTRQNVITHGDLWCNNIMFDNSSPKKCILFDFQWNRYCPIAQDVILVLHYCNSKEFRAKHLEEMLLYYMEIMNDILCKHGLKDEVLKWEDFMESIKEQTIMAKIYMVLCFPSIFMDGDFCEKMMSDTEKSMEFMFYDKAPMTMSLIKKGGEYETRVKEAVIELVEMCNNTGL